MSSEFKGVSIADYEEESYRVMDGDAIGYINSGSDGEITFRENTASAAR